MSVTVQGLVTGVFVAIVVHCSAGRMGLDWSVTRKYGVVVRTMVAELAALEMLVNMGAAGVGNTLPLPLNVTAPTWASALPSSVELASMVMDA